MKKKKNTTRISAEIKKETHAKLYYIAKRHGRSLAKTITRALELYVTIYEVQNDEIYDLPVPDVAELT